MRKLRLAALVLQEPDASLDYFNVAPKVFLNLADLPATGLVQQGSRIRYRLVDRRRCQRGRTLRQHGQARTGARTTTGDHRRSATGNPLLARARRPLPRTRRTGIGGAGCGGRGDGRAPAQRAPPVGRRGDALPRCQPAHAGRDPCGRDGAARIVRQRAGRAHRVRPAMARRPLAGKHPVDVDPARRRMAGVAGTRRRHGGAARLRRAAGAGAAAGVGVARAAPRPGCDRTQCVAGRAGRHRRHGRTAVVEGRLGDARRRDAGRHRRHAGGAGDAGLAADRGGAPPALAAAWQPALRPGQRQSPRRHQHRAGVRARASG